MADEAVRERVSMTEQANDQAPDWEAEARKTGWRPKGEFPGATEKWIDAEQWVRRGEQFIPFLQASKRELQEKYASVESQLAESRRQNQAILASLNELKTGFTEQTVEGLETKKAEMKAAIVKAHTDGDVERELNLRDALAELNDEIRTAKTPKPAVAPQSTQSPESPEFLHFLSDNPWFKDDTVMAAAAVAAMGQLNADSDKVRWSADRKYAEVAKIIRQRFGVSSNDRREAPSRVEGGRMENSRSGGGRTFEDLPSDARAACDTLAKRFVGKPDAGGKIKYPDLASYRAKYTGDYFAEDWGARAQSQ